jgi:hypothetical protein
MRLTCCDCSSALAKTVVGEDLLKESLAAQPQAKLEIFELMDNSAWSQACAASYRGICVIHASSQESGYTGDILNAVVKDRDGTNTIAKAVTLMHVDGDCKLSFIEQFGISSTTLPTLILYAPFKQRYAVFKGGLTEVGADHRLR